MKKWLTLIGLVLLAAGPATLLGPEQAATAYGIGIDSPPARVYLIATAIRDMALGVWLLAALALGATGRMLAASLLAIALVAAGDALNVMVHAGWAGAHALIIHLGGLTVLLATAWRLWRAERN